MAATCMPAQNTEEEKEETREHGSFRLPQDRGWLMRIKGRHEISLPF